MTPNELSAGSQVGGYRLDRLLGEGGMGQVYEARGPDGARVALKVIRGRFAQDDTFRRRFRLEARIAQEVVHPSLVPVLAAGEDEGVPYIVQEFIEGRSLEAELELTGPLEVPVAIGIGSDVAAGLEALWDAGMVHRDVKPANILLAGGRAVITDFGLAKDTRGPALTLQGQVFGSPDYMAPEQIRQHPVTAATDVYALGCVMYECLCGRAPFAHAESPFRVRWCHLQEEPPDPRRSRPDLSPALAEALLHALEKEPDRRPDSAGDYLGSLAAAASGGTGY